VKDALKIHGDDLVAVALHPLPYGDNHLGVTLREDIPEGHKFALCDIAEGTPVIKYGLPIGFATVHIPAGSWVHTHNVRTGLSEDTSYTYSPEITTIPPATALEFDGYLRTDGRVGIRNELWIIPTVGCVNDICRTLEQESAHLAEQYGLDGVYHFPHPYGCSQLGDDHEATRTLLSALCRHPNAGGVLVVGLGCENNKIDEFQTLFVPQYAEKLRFMVCQQEGDESAVGKAHLESLASYASQSKRRPQPASRLVVGMKCGGSDGLSGITANPVVGAFSDLLIAMGGTTILTEVPEMFGAEALLFNRCKDTETFRAALDMVNRFKHYFTSHGQVVYENPSPGNKDGGITTLEDKSLGCVQKGGFSPVVGVLDYAEPIKEQGLNLLYGPGNDLVSATALAASGAQMVLFTTGRGTPFGSPVPTVKISTNSKLATQKPHWIDFNAGTVAEGEGMATVAEQLMELVVDIANGTSRTRSEEHNQRGIAIWKNGITL